MNTGRELSSRCQTAVSASPINPPLPQVLHRQVDPVLTLVPQAAGVRLGHLEAQRAAAAPRRVKELEAEGDQGDLQGCRRNPLPVDHLVDEVVDALGTAA